MTEPYCYQCALPMGARGCPHTLDEPPIVIAVPDAVRLQVLEELYADPWSHDEVGQHLDMAQRVARGIVILRERVAKGGG